MSIWKKKDGSFLIRGLQFTSLALRRNVDDPAEELQVSFTKSYEVTLRQHHNMLIRPIFSVSENIDVL